MPGTQWSLGLAITQSTRPEKGHFIQFHPHSGLAIKRRRRRLTCPERSCLMEGEKPKKRGEPHQDVIARARILDPAHGGCRQKAEWKAFWKGDMSFSERQFAESLGVSFSPMKPKSAAHKQGSSQETHQRRRLTCPELHSTSMVELAFEARLACSPLHNPLVSRPCPPSTQHAPSTPVHYLPASSSS